MCTYNDAGEYVDAEENCRERELSLGADVCGKAMFDGLMWANAVCSLDVPCGEGAVVLVMFTS